MLKFKTEVWPPSPDEIEATPAFRQVAEHMDSRLLGTLIGEFAICNFPDDETRTRVVEVIGRQVFDFDSNKEISYHAAARSVLTHPANY